MGRHVSKGPRGVDVHEHRAAFRRRSPVRRRRQSCEGGAPVLVGQFLGTQCQNAIGLAVGNRRPCEMDRIGAAGTGILDGVDGHALDTGRLQQNLSQHRFLPLQRAAEGVADKGLLDIRRADAGLFERRRQHRARKVPESTRLG